MKRLSIFLLFCGLAHGQSMLSLMAASGSAGGAPDCTPVSGYLHCRKLVIDHTQVGGSTLTNYPLLVSTVFGTNALSSSCFDHVYTVDSGGTTKVPWEIENCSPPGGWIDWVGIPSISSIVDTAFFVSYDNSLIITTQNTGANGPTNVWDANFLTVFHLPNGITLSGLDSTANATNATPSVSVIAGAGLIDGAAQVVSSTATQTTFSTSGVGLTVGTVQMWSHQNSASNSGSTQYFFDTELSRCAFINLTGSSIPVFMYNDGRSTNFTAPSWSANTWHHFVFAYNKTGNVQRFFLDGVEQTGSGATGTWGSTSAGTNAYIGNRFDSSAGMPGIFDEVRTSNIIRPDGWYIADYNSQKAGSTFITVGAEN